MRLNNIPKPDYVQVCLFSIFLIVGLFIYKDFGIGWDEEIQRKTGLVSHEYVSKDSKELLEWQDKDYGVAFELPLIIVEKNMSSKKDKDIYQMRHLVTHLFFLLGGLAIYKLIRLLLKDKMLAAIGTLLYFLHPRIYTDSFYNTKDIPFVALYAICLYWSAKAFQSHKKVHFLILGIFTGLLINARIMGVLFFSCVFVFFLIDIITDGIQGRKVLNTTASFLLFICFTLITLYTTWPYLWIDPWHNFAEAFINMSKFRWPGEVLLKGELIKATELPWFYAPLWMGITTPIFNMIIGLFGIAIAFGILIRKPLQYLRNVPERNIVLALISLVVPIAAVIVLHSVLYDAWRQLFFLYVPFILLAVLGIYYLQAKVNRKLVYGLAFLFLGLQACSMISKHPFGNIYFNSFTNKTPEYIRHNYEMDYWGVNFNQSLDYILAHDTSKHIKVTGRVGTPSEINTRILYKDTRISYSDPVDADYFITNYRGHTEDYKEYEGYEFHSFIINNSKVHTIFRHREMFEKAYPELSRRE
ncbi:MAG TPA: glycosyltransferase family 39 protein [Chitinophagaceae bacterium]|nr:glycosyltransferase family 39 protein [Chitinophagaceae bacterium]